MKKYVFLLVIFLSTTTLLAQINCDALLWQQDTLQYKACKLVNEKQHKYHQFDKRFHKLMNDALEICPYFAYAYREISSSYVKSGNFIEWKKNIDNAVKYAPIEYIPLRASMKYKFFADYEGSINDIDSLKTLISGNIGYTSNGTYHLNIVKGLCLKALGRIDEAIDIIEKQSEIEGDYGLYNYLHLGVLYMEKKDFKTALANFKKQAKANNIAENHYYMALCYKDEDDINNALVHLKQAQMLYESGNKMVDPYNELFDQIYLSQIKDELRLIQE